MELLEGFVDLSVMPATDVPNWSLLKVSGLSGNPLELDLATLLSLPQSTLTQGFLCNDGWVCRNQKWEGVTVKSLLEKIDLNNDAHIVGSGRKVRTC